MSKSAQKIKYSSTDPPAGGEWRSSNNSSRLASLARTIFVGVVTFLIFGLSAPGVLAATLSLDPAAGTFNRGCAYQVKIQLDTQSAQTDGTDAILLFDNSKLTPPSSSVTNGTIYSDYLNIVDAAGGKVAVSGLASPSQSYAGSGTLATVTFQVKDNAATGPTAIRFDFDPADKGKTTDSNVVERTTVAELLSSVTDGSYTIGTGTTCTGIGTPTGPTATPRPSGLGAPTTGTPSATVVPYKPFCQNGELSPNCQTPGFSAPTVILATVGGILVIIGILGLALL